MALITCPECGTTVSDKAASCPKCGCPISGASEAMISFFPPTAGQVFGTGCTVTYRGSEIGKCKLGQTCTVSCTEKMNVTIKANGMTVETEIEPGGKYKVDVKSGLFLPKIYVTKVDAIM